MHACLTQVSAWRELLKKKKKDDNNDHKVVFVISFFFNSYTNQFKRIFLLLDVFVLFFSMFFFLFDLFFGPIQKKVLTVDCLLSFFVFCLTDIDF